MDLLFGLDMLKAHQATIDLEKNVLRIQGREVKFLSEHELPDKARDGVVLDNNGEPSNPRAGPSSSSQAPPAPSSFPGGGNTLSSAPRGVIPGSSSGGGAAAVHSPASRAPALAAGGGGRSQWPETDIEMLINFGASREQAIQVLDAAGGNVDVAASLLF